MQLTETYTWRDRRVRWGRRGSGPAVVFCHGTPWSSRLWAPFAEAMAADFTTYLWDMPGYGESSKDPDHAVSLDAPHLVTHDYGGAIALRAHLLHDVTYASLALVDVVALAPWGSDFFRLVRDNTDVFMSLPPAIHEGALRAYIAAASHRGLSREESDLLAGPWLDDEGRAAFYRQIGQADEVYTDEIEPRYGSLELPVLVVWGREDRPIPVDRAHRLAAAIPGARLEIVDDADHLIQLDQPVRLATTLQRWLTSQA